MPSINFHDFLTGTPAEALRAAAAYLREHPGTKLIIPAGVYRITLPKARQLQQEVMAGLYGSEPQDRLFIPQMPYEKAFPLDGLKDVEIDATGALFLYDGFLENVSIEHCENVTLRGLSIDLVRKAYSHGKIIACGEDYTDVDFGTLSDISSQMPSGRIAIIGKESGYIDTITSSSKKEELGENRIRFYGFSAKEDIGADLYVWHSYHFRPSIHIYQSKNTHLENVTIYNQSGMGVVGFQSENIFMKGLRIVPSCGESISTNTDATHFSSCRGEIRFESCFFEGHGDDATNVHGYYYDLENAGEGRYKLYLHSSIMSHSCKLDYPLVGDCLELSKKSSLVPLETYTVKGVTPDEANWCCYVELDRALPEDLAAYYLTNRTATPSLIFRDCYVKNNIARCVLAKTHHVLIENCTFDHSTGTAVHVGAEAYWREGLVSNHVVIRNNRFLDCGAYGWGRILEAGGISINILSDDPYAPVHKDFLIEGNSIECPHTAHAIYAGNVEGLTICQNALLSQQEAIRTECCEEVEISENRLVPIL